MSSQAIELVHELLQQGQEVCFHIRGYSMQPALQSGDRVQVRHVSNDDYNVGDLALFEKNDQWIVHRIIKCEERGGKVWVHLKGDASEEIDVLCVSNLLGKARYSNSNLSNVSPS